MRSLILLCIAFIVVFTVSGCNDIIWETEINGDKVQFNEFDATSNLNDLRVIVAKSDGREIKYFSCKINGRIGENSTINLFMVILTVPGSSDKEYIGDCLPAKAKEDFAVYVAHLKKYLANSAQVDYDKATAPTKTETSSN